jgi:hypothetical protein
VGVIDPLRGAVHITRLARVHQRGNDLVMVLTAEQLGLTRIKSNTWDANGKANVRSHRPCCAPEITSHLLLIHVMDSLTHCQEGRRKGMGAHSLPSESPAPVEGPPLSTPLPGLEHSLRGLR